MSDLTDRHTILAELVIKHADAVGLSAATHAGIAVSLYVEELLATAWQQGRDSEETDSNPYTLGVKDND